MLHHNGTSQQIWLGISDMQQFWLFFVKQNMYLYSLFLILNISKTKHSKSLNMTLLPIEAKKWLIILIMKLTSSSMNTFVPLPFISDIGNVILKLFNQLKPLFSSEIKLYSQDRLLTDKIKPLWNNTKIFCYFLHPNPTNFYCFY